MRLARRTLLAASPALLLPRAPARAAAERHVWLQNQAGEEVAVAYRAGQEHDPAAMERLRHLFRDLRAGQEGPLPPLLVDMLSLLQEGWEYQRPLLVTSGFRTRETNMAVEGAAAWSLHLSGRAADLVVPGMPLEDLGARAARQAQLLGFMGIGVYPRCVHLDVGPQRVWSRPAG